MKDRTTFAVTLLVVALVLPQPSAGAQHRCHFFPETQHQVCGRILEYWEQNGGLPIFGFPITDQVDQHVEGRTLQLQWFERNRLELHPQNARPYDVLLGRLGAGSLLSQGRDWNSFGEVGAEKQHFFPQTGHAIAPQFWGYWSSHGLEFDGRPGSSFEESLALFGMPLSKSVFENNPTNGQPYLTQHFERARFEFHPENAGSPYEVLLGLLGVEQSGAVPAPAAAPPSHASQVIDLVNQERAAAGCPALAVNDTLMRIAHGHSQDMASHNFFSHDGSDGRSAFQRMQDAGYRYRRAAENLAGGVATPADAVALWMASPGHRSNILNCALRETGVGYVEDPGDPLNYGSYWTQDFGTR